MYSFVRDGDTFVVSIDNHQEMVAALAAFCEEQGILAGEVTGIGAVNHAVLRFLDPATKKYVDKTFEEQMEISSLVGNISEKDGKVYPVFYAVVTRNRGWEKKSISMVMLSVPLMAHLHGRILLWSIPMEQNVPDRSMSQLL